MFTIVHSVQGRIHAAAMRLFAERGVTQVTVSDLAEAAGVARGTVYNNFGRASSGNVQSLFEEVATRLTTEMDARVAASVGATHDPAERLANGMRSFVRRAHEEPLWGRFLVRFGASSPTLRSLLAGAPTRDVLTGIERGRFDLRPDQVPSAVALASSGVLAAIWLVLDGIRTWRDAGADVAGLVLRALGVPADEARRLGAGDLPPLPSDPAD
jgi:AcrR family transcriptional regulator